MTETASKFDTGKAPLCLIDSDALLDVAQVFAFGEKKYARHNWRKGIEATRLLDAAQRHILELQAGRDIDSESGLNHAAHGIACLLMFMATMRDKPEFDDRYKVCTQK